MKSDINLKPLDPLKRTYAILMIAIALCLIVILAIALPIHHRSKLRIKSQKVTQELMNTEESRRQYLDLKEYSAQLLQRIQIVKETASTRGNIVELLEILDSSLSPHIELQEVSISGNILSIKGVAPNYRSIANNMLMLQENQNILSAEIQEIFLDKDIHKRIFSIRCKTTMNSLSADDIFINKWGANNDDSGGGDS